MNKTAKTFTSNLARLLKESGWSQQELANKVGISQGQVSNYLRGANPTFEALESFSSAFGVSISDLFSTDSEVKPNIERHPLAEELSQSVKTAVHEAFEHVDILKDQEIKKLKAEIETIRKQLQAYIESGAEPDELSLLCRQVPPKLRSTVRQVLERMVNDQTQTRKRSSQG